MRGIVKWVLIVVVLCAIGQVVFHCALISVWVISEGRHLEQKQRRLFHQTNYTELAAACREIIADVRSEELPAGHYIPDDSGRIHGVPLPEAVRRLEPVYVRAYTDHVLVALIGGMVHCGVTIYDDPNHISRSSDNDIQLGDGVWYYDDGLREDPNYMERLRRKLQRVEERSKSGITRAGF